MKDFLIHLFFLILLNIHDHSLTSAAFHRHNVVNSSMKAVQTSTQSDNIASLAFDEDSNTCSDTTDQAGGTFWYIDLAEAHVISEVVLYTDADGFGAYTRVYIGNDTQTVMSICGNTFNMAEGLNTWTCKTPISGQYVKVEGRSSMTSIRICEIEIFECDNGYYGNCTDEEQCRCRNSDTCNKVSGVCDDGLCVLGWHQPACNQECSPGHFGDQCEQQCHCYDNGDCNSATGVCVNGRCADSYHGTTCETRTPDMSMIKPFVPEKAARWLIVGFSKAHGSLASDASLYYTVMYKPHSSHGNYSWTNITMESTGRVTETIKVQNLTVNTNYLFKVMPYVRLNGQVIDGVVSQESKPHRTPCDDPDHPNIEEIQAGVMSTDESLERQRNVDDDVYITVTFSMPENAVSNCDQIIWLRVYHSDPVGHWASKGGILYQPDGEHRYSYNITGLTQGMNYKVRVYAINNMGFNASSSIASVTTAAIAAPPSTAAGSLSVTLIAVIVVIAVLLLVLVGVALAIYRKKSKYTAVPQMGDKTAEEGATSNNVHNNSYLEGTISNNITPTKENHVGRTPSPASGLPEDKNSPATSKKPELPYIPDLPEESSKPIPVEELENYVMSKLDDDRNALRKEYQEIEIGLTAQHEIGKQRDNKFKNRFVNIIAYDHSRVVLDEVPGDPSSHYVNANYIDGYKKPKHYVAAQGCNKYTLQDMWRMTWQLNSNCIIMVTNLVENGKRKCDQYWPSTGEKVYGDIAVRFLDMEETSDFAIRSFHLTKDGETRICKQFHFIAWPDHGVPSRAGPILAFRHKVRSYELPEGAPIIIHCSAGVGRTGTFIALDYLLEQAADTNVVDVFNIVCRMRQNRVNMIQTVEQYLFVYDALLDALKSGNTCIKCPTFREDYKKLCEVDKTTGKNALQVQFETLQAMSPKVKEEDCRSGLLPENEDKNRNPSILPADRHRPYLMIRVEGTNDYINAVFLDGYRKRNSYIITQMPLGHTVIDFWRMVYEHNCQSVIMLNPVDSDATYGKYWLEDEICDCGPFVIEPMSVDSANSNITIREHKLTYEPQKRDKKESSPSLLPKRKDEARVVAQFELTCWKDNDSVPSSPTAMVALIDLVERHQQKTGDGPVVIHCGDGVSHSGLFAVVSCILEKMKLEQEVDIFHTVKQLRYYRPEIITDIEQYKFCHDVVLTYLAEFETYANFR